MIKPKLPPYFIGRIMNIADNLINQIRQTPSISGCHACNLPLIKSSQRGGGPSNGHKGAHNQISTSESTTQISISSLRKANSLIKELYNSSEYMGSGPRVQVFRGCVLAVGRKVGLFWGSRLSFFEGMPCWDGISPKKGKCGLGSLDACHRSRW